MITQYFLILCTYVYTDLVMALYAGNIKVYGAGDRIRTDDILLGKQTLCQLSYTRVPLIIANEPPPFQVAEPSSAEIFFQPPQRFAREGLDFAVKKRRGYARKDLA